MSAAERPRTARCDRAQLDQFRRIVVKIGSSLLVDRDRGAAEARLAGRAGRRHRPRCTRAGADVLVVSSGAIALGRTVLELPSGALKLEESQAAAAVGQIALARAWAEALGHHGITAGQILVTLGDTEERRRYLNARATIGTPAELGAVPVINENDTVATSEIRYGDNDRLAARVATMAGADLLVLLSDIDGLYTAPPQIRPAAALIPVRAAHHARDRGDGRRRRLGAVARRHAHQDRGRRRSPPPAAPPWSSPRASDRTRSRAHRRRRALHLVPAPSQPRRRPARAGSPGTLEPRGVAALDAGARAAPPRRQEPAARRRHARRGRVRARRRGGDARRRTAARSAAASSPTTRPTPPRIAGRSSRDIEAILGYAGRAAMVHRDDMALRLRNDGRRRRWL